MWCARRSVSRSPVWTTFCVVAPQCTHRPASSPAARASFQTSGTRVWLVPLGRLVDPLAVEQVQPCRRGDRGGRVGGHDAQPRLRLGQCGLDVQPGLPPGLQPVQLPDARVRDPAVGGRVGDQPKSPVAFIAPDHAGDAGGRRRALGGPAPVVGRRAACRDGTDDPLIKSATLDLLRAFADVRSHWSAGSWVNRGPPRTTPDAMSRPSRRQHCYSGARCRAPRLAGWNCGSVPCSPDGWTSGPHTPGGCGSVTLDR